MAVGVARHGPPGTGAVAEVVAGGQTVDEGHVVPDHAALETVLELHGLGSALLVDLEGRVAGGALGQDIGPGTAWRDGAGAPGVAAWTGEGLEGDLIGAGVLEEDLAGLGAGCGGGRGYWAPGGEVGRGGVGGRWGGRGSTARGSWRRSCRGADGEGLGHCAVVPFVLGVGGTEGEGGQKKKGDDALNHFDEVGKSDVSENLRVMMAS